MEYRYKVGQKVRIRPDLNDLGEYKMVSGTDPGYKPGITYKMVEYAGKVTTISSHRTTYTLEGFGSWAWADEMLEPVNKLYCKSLL